jgi:serine/threonine protein kinase
MGIVYRARQAPLGRLVALKVLPPGAASDAVAVARFRREIKALGRCDHPNVVRVLSAGFSGDRHYYAMELVDGCSLDRIYRLLSDRMRTSGGRLSQNHLSEAISSASDAPAEGESTDPEEFPDATPPPAAETAVPSLPGNKGYFFDIAGLMAQTARGVQHLHDHGIIHRDLKPGNVMASADGQRAVITDLGLARLTDQSQSLTRSNVRILGTLRYMAPEQLQHRLLEVTHLADVYSLGATLYELLALVPIHDGDTEQRLIHQVLHEEPASCCVACPVARAGGSRCTFHGTDFGAFRRLREVLTGLDR